MSLYANGYQYRRKITIDHDQVSGSADLTDFAFYFKTTNADFESVANGGKIQLSVDSNGDPLVDVRFETTGGTKLDHEIVEYVPTSGLITCFIRIPTLSYTTDTELYIYYGKTLTSAEDNRTGVWNAKYKGVWHGAWENPYIRNNNTAPRGITGLGEVNNVANQIQYGYRSGDLTWVLNQFNGSPNNGEIQLQGSSFTDHAGNVRSFSTGSGNDNVDFPDAVNGNYFIVYSVTDIFTRFGATAAHANNHPHFFVAQFVSNQWQQIKGSDNSRINFTPASTDVIVGRVTMSGGALTVAGELRFETGYMMDSTEVNHFNSDNTRWLNGENAGKIFEGGRTFAGADYSRAGDDAVNFGSMSTMSVSFWVKTTDTNAGLISYANSSFDNAILIYITGSDVNFYLNNDIATWSGGASTLADGNWHLVQYRWRSSSAGISVYVDGAVALSAGSMASGETLASGGAFFLAQEQDSVNGGWSSAQALAGQIEDVRICNDIDFDTADRHITDYNNQNSPGTFWALASEESLPDLAPADASHGHSLDAAGDLTEHKTLAINDGLHAHALDNVALTQKHQLVVNDLLHDHSLDGDLTLVENITLVVNDLLHNHILDETQAIPPDQPVPADLLHDHSLEAVVLTQKHVLTVDSLLHDNTLDNVDLSQAHQLSVQDAIHAHTIDNINLSQAHLLAVADALHAHALESTDLTQKHALTVADLLHGQTLDSPFVYTQQEIVVQDMLHAHMSGGVVILISVRTMPNGLVIITGTPRGGTIELKPAGMVDPRNAKLLGLESNKPLGRGNRVVAPRINVKP